MTESRVETVLEAIRNHMNTHGPIASDSLAQAAIEASDAWLKAQGVFIPQLPATKLELEAFYRGKATDLGEELMDEALARRGIRLRSPSPEEPDK